MKLLIALAVLALPLAIPVEPAIAVGLSARMDTNLQVQSQVQSLAQAKPAEPAPAKEPVVENNSQNTVQAESKGLNVEKLFRSFNTLNIDLPAITTNVRVKSEKNQTQPRRPAE